MNLNGPGYGDSDNTEKKKNISIQNQDEDDDDEDDFERDVENTCDVDENADEEEEDESGNKPNKVNMVVNINIKSLEGKKKATKKPKKIPSKPEPLMNNDLLDLLFLYLGVTTKHDVDIKE